MISNPILNLIKKDTIVLILLAIFSFFVASILMSGWPAGLVPEIKTPYLFEGDVLAYFMNIQRIIENAWFFENGRSGFPFGSNYLDFPTSDTGNYLIIKLFGTVFNSTAAAANLYFLLGFAICAPITYLVVRSIGLSRENSIACAILYTFSAYHFARLGHLFFTWYFVIPLFFYTGFKLLSNRTIFTNKNLPWKYKIYYILYLIILSSFGIYYDLFGCMVLLMCTLIATVIYKSLSIFIEGFIIILTVTIGLLLNVLPSLLYIAQNGANMIGINRGAYESELYAFKIIQLLIPRADHRIEAFSNFSYYYNSHMPLITENMSASLGAIGAIGFLYLLGFLLFSPFLTKNNPSTDKSHYQISNLLTLKVLAILSISLSLFGTIGGGSSLFALTVTTSFRGWNRLSIFINFIALASIFLVIQSIIQNWRLTKNHSSVISIGIAIIIAILGFYDQTVKSCPECMATRKVINEKYKDYFSKLETSLPKNAAIFQYPYVIYPESAPINNIFSYDHALGFLFSKDLRWSFGGVQGREGDWFYSRLSALPIDQQLLVARNMGFSGIYIDRRAFITNVENDDRCKNFPLSKQERTQINCITINEIESDIEKAIGKSAIEQQIQSSDKQLAYFPFPSDKVASAQSTAAKEILSQIGYTLVQGYPKQIENSFEVPIDLTKDNSSFPNYLYGITGLSVISVKEGVKTGRWSDAYEAKHVTIWLTQELPKKFTLHINAQAAGLNIFKPVKIKIGNQVKEVLFDADFRTKSVSFNLEKSAKKIEFIPADPFRPSRRWGIDDHRKLAIQLAKISIVPEK